MIFYDVLNKTLFSTFAEITNTFIFNTFTPVIDYTMDERTVKDSNGNPLKEGDSVVLIKSLPVKGTSVTLKKGMVIKNIHLTDDDEEIECRVEKVKMVLKTMYLKRG